MKKLLGLILFFVFTFFVHGSYIDDSVKKYIQGGPYLLKNHSAETNSYFFVDDIDNFDNTFRIESYITNANDLGDLIHLPFNKVLIDYYKLEYRKGYILDDNVFYLIFYDKVFKKIRIRLYGYGIYIEIEGKDKDKIVESFKKAIKIYSGQNKGNNISVLNNKTTGKRDLLLFYSNFYGYSGCDITNDISYRIEEINKDELNFNINIVKSYILKDLKKEKPERKLGLLNIDNEEYWYIFYTEGDYREIRIYNQLNKIKFTGNLLKKIDGNNIKESIIIDLLENIRNEKKFLK